MNKIRDLISSITKNSDDYDEKYMKIKFNSNARLPLKKLLEIYSMTIVVQAVFHELLFLKELMLIKQANQESVIFATVGIF